MKPIRISRLKFSVLPVAVLVLILTSACSSEIEISSGRSELGDAASMYKVQEVKNLLANGADVNFIDKFGDTALMRASAKGNTEIMKILLDHGADVTINQKDKFGETALDKASKRGGYEGAMKLLKAAGAK